MGERVQGTRRPRRSPSHRLPRLFSGLLLAASVASLITCRVPAIEEAVPPPPTPKAPSPEPTPAAAPEPEPEPEPLPPPLALPGLDGAAQALAAGHPDEALRRLAVVSQEETGGPWIREDSRRAAIRGRAARLLGDYAVAVAALEPLVAKPPPREPLPRELLELELAWARSAWAASGELATEEADRQLAAAATLLGKATKRKPIRNLALLRVEQARILARIDGGGGKSSRAAALRASKALAAILRDYPEHPEVGEHRLAYAQALIRSGRSRDGAEALRALMIDRAGEAEAEAAASALGALAAAEPKTTIPAGPLNTSERLAQAEAARRLRNVDLSRGILDAIVAEDTLPPSQRRSALRSRAWTAYKQRDYAACAADLEVLYAEVKAADTRDFLGRCLDRAGSYDRALELLLAQTEGRSGRGYTGRIALWGALQQAVRGGRYSQARELLARYNTKFKGHLGDRQWLDAWLKMRTGDHAEAIAAFEPLEARGSDRTRARYFRGRLLLATDDPDDRALGESRLRALVERHGLEYYGLMARQRLLDAGIDPGPPPTIAPIADEDAPLPEGTIRELFRTLAADYGEAHVALARAEALYAVGYLDEARRELRIAIDEHLQLTGRSGYEPRHEDRYVGLSWRSTWSQPKLAPTREARKLHRDRAAAEELRRGLRALARALGEPYRFARLSTRDDGSLAMRWYLRAFRAEVEAAAAAREIDALHLWALMYTESRFRSHVLSPVGARGVLQIMPWTGQQLAARLGELGPRFDADTLFDPATNIHLAAYYVSELLDKFHGQPAFAYGSYNGGPSNVSRWLAAKSSGGEPLELDVYVEEIPFGETARYTRRVLETQAIYSLLYRGELPRWSNAVDPNFENNIDF